MIDEDKIFEDIITFTKQKEEKNNLLKEFDSEDGEGVDLDKLDLMLDDEYQKCRKVKFSLEQQEAEEVRLIRKKLEECESWELNDMTLEFLKQKENDKIFAEQMKRMLGPINNGRYHINDSYILKSIVGKIIETGDFE